MNSRMFSDEEMAQLSRSPWVVAEEALAAGDRKAAETALSGLEAGCRSQMDRYVSWVANIFEGAAERGRPGGTAALVQTTRRFFAVSPDAPFLEPADPAAAATAVFERSTGTTELGGALDEWLGSWRRTIDLHRDWISALLGRIYQDGGPDELEWTLRYCGRQGMAGAVAEHAGRPVRTQLEGFVHLLHGHFAELEVVEDDSKFVIEQDPCGTCTRQVTDGRFGPPLNLPMVTEAHTVTWNRGTTTIYRSHIPVWHVAMAIEAIGVPWPVNQCPHGLDAGVCRILLYKDPRNPEATAGVPTVG